MEVEFIRLADEIPECEFLIEGYPGIGMVGVIAIRHVVTECGAEPVFVMKAKDMPTAAIVHEGRVYPSAGVFVLDDLSFFYSEQADMRPGVVQKISESVADLSREIGVECIVCLAGIRAPDLEGEPSLYYAATSDKAAELFDGIAEPLEGGTITGVSGPLLLEGSLRGLDAVCLLVETPGTYPDPKAASRVVEALNEALGLSVDVSKLEEEAERIAKAVEETVHRLREQQRIEEEEAEPTERMFV
ncbi:proteasome assembly chaperone family protein [Methanopyrus sp. KOL6]|uniref:proteasome assembly chaperone family protein n=1 Tax=Methanopyrus sp. KOL6 TaxID=1937004 RepID=UPI000B4A85AA|nr:proteasome assembly chaperone family protein [Methanopyrus sp. KOL6]